MADVGISVGLRGVEDVARGFGQIDAGAKKLKGQAEQSASAFGRLKDSFTAMSKAAAAFGAIGVAMKLADLEDQMEQTARAAFKLNVSFESFQALQLTAKRFGADISSVNIALRTFQRQIGDASLQPMGVQAKLFEALGVSVRDAAGEIRDTESVFRDTIDAIARVGSEAEKSKLLAALFGEQAVELKTMLGEGTEGIDKFRDHLKSIGAIVSEDVAPAMRDANSVVLDFTDAIQGRAMQVMADAIIMFENFGAAASFLQDNIKPKPEQESSRDMLAGFRKDFMTKPNVAGALDMGKAARDKAAAAKAEQDAQKALREEQDKVRASLEALRAEDQALAQANEALWADARSMVESVLTPLERYGQEMTDINATFNAGGLSVQEYSRLVDDLNLKLADSNRTVNLVEGALDSVFDAAINGGEDFLDTLEDIGKQLGKELLRDNVFDPLKTFAKQGLGSLLGGGGEQEGADGAGGAALADPMKLVFDQLLSGLGEIFGGGEEGFLGGLTKLFMGDEGILGSLGSIFSTAWEFMGGLLTSFLTELGIMQAWEIAERWALSLWEMAERWAIAIFEAVAGFFGFETGGDLTVTRPTLLMVGEKNKAERVRVSPLGGPVRANAAQNVQRMIDQQESGNILQPQVNVYIPQTSIVNDLTAGSFARRISGAVRRENSRLV